MRTPTKTPLTIITFDDNAEGVSPITLSPCSLDERVECDGGQRREPPSTYRLWMQSDPSHNKTPPTSKTTADLQGDEDDEDDPFAFNLFGRSKWGSRTRERLTYWYNGDELMTAEVVDSSLDTNNTVEKEKLKVRTLFHMAHVKVNLKLSLIAKGIEFVAMGTIGCRYLFQSWISLALQLLCAFGSSSSELWRFAGKFGLPYEAVNKDLQELFQRRECIALILQSIWKLLGAVFLTAFAVWTLYDDGRIDTHYEKLMYLGAGFCTGGFIAKISLNAWMTYISQRKLSDVHHSLNAESLFSYIMSLSSLKTAVICYAIITYPENEQKIRTINRGGAIAEICIAFISLLLIVRDVYMIRKI